MKKSFGAYALIWAILLTIFNAVVFLARPVIAGFEIHYDIRFWVAWASVTVAFLGNLACAYVAFKTENLKKVFYRLPLITVSYTGLIVMLICGTALMLIPNCPAWIAAVACVIVFAANATAIIKAGWAGSTVAAVDEKVQTKTAFIKTATLDAQNLMNRAESDAVRAACKKVYEALRYADPMSNDALSVAEAKITVKLDELATAVQAADEEKAREIADEVVLLVKERNNKCKALK